MTAIQAMLVDAYRELNSKKLFWITLFISAFVMLTYASIGFNEQGMSFFFGLWDVESEFVREDTPVARLLYRSLFSSFIVGLWLAWVAIILALISTTTIFPDFLASGSIDFVLSKPIGRVKVFLTKYITSLLFVFLQVAIFCVGVFLCLGWRVGEWNWLIFAAIPLVTLLFSYLYCFNVLIGTWTRSALTALLLTLLFWFTIFGVNMAEQIVLQIKIDQQIDYENQQEQVEQLEGQLALLGDAPEQEAQRDMIRAQISAEAAFMNESKKIVDKLDPWLDRIGLLKWPAPKTGETIALLDRWLKRDTDVPLMEVFRGNIDMNEKGEFVPKQTDKQSESAERLLAFYEQRSVWYVLGTSLAFELIVLSLACFIFVRRDF